MPDLLSHDFLLRGVPFLLAALYLGFLLGSIILRSIRGTNNWFVRSQELVKFSLIYFFLVVGLRLSGGPAAHPYVVDLACIMLGIGATVGMPFAAQFFYLAARDELHYWQWRKTGVPASPPPHETLAESDIPPVS